jgi:hypothetical protein
VSWLVGRGSSHGRLTGPYRLRLREPGEVDVLDRASESLGLEMGTVWPFLDPHDEDLVDSVVQVPFAVSSGSPPV